MNSLEKYFEDNTGRLIFKWQHYFEVYDNHFKRYKDKEVVIFEIGVSQGGSLQMWKDYFGPKARIIGIDIDPRCKAFEEPGIEIYIGSQSDRNFLKNLVQKLPKFDILIDDGGHSMRQQIVSFEELFNHVKSDGVYLCEDCHTSYWWSYGGGYKRAGTFIEYSKKWIDKINAFHSRSTRLKVDEFTKSVKSLHYYDSIVVVEKGPITKPFASKRGTPTFEYTKVKKSIPQKLKSGATGAVNLVSSWLKLPYHI